MQYKFVPMSMDYAYEIAYKWKYSESYSFYDMTADEDDLMELLNEKNWDNGYFGVLNEDNELIGYYSFNFDEDIMWMGFGLKPELTGMGKGKEFVTEGINFGVDKFNYKKDYIMLAVAVFNKRAIKLYENMGFQPLEEYMQSTNGGEYKFVKMRKYI